MTPFGRKVRGISGDTIAVGDQVTVPCRIAERCVVHQFVATQIVKSALLGKDFLWKHQAIWDWKAGELCYQSEEETPEVAEQPSHLAKEEELQPKSVSCLWVVLQLGWGHSASESIRTSSVAYGGDFV